MDVDAIINNAATKTKGKKKKDVPTFEVDAATGKAIKAWKEAKKVKTTAEAKMKDKQEEIVPVARKFHLEEVKKQGKVFTTVKLMAKDGLEVQVDVAKDQYSKIPSECEEELKERFGSDYDKMFEKKRDIKLTAKALGDKDTLKKLIKAVGGPEVFNQFFEVTDYLAPKSLFHEARFLADDDGDLDDRVDQVVKEELVKPFSPAMRG